MTPRTWLITGVSSGFGHERTKQLLKLGECVVGTIRRLDTVADFVERYPDRFR
jgi:NADP-dependent 3-hydroxy acid dehydrogenase YdfG